MRSRPACSAAEGQLGHRLDHDRPGQSQPRRKRQLTAITGTRAEFPDIQARVYAFAQIMTERRGRELAQWNERRQRPAKLQSIIAGLRRDQDAVTTGLTQPWSSGSVEGHINRLKMYCRASPDLLHRPVLLGN